MALPAAWAMANIQYAKKETQAGRGLKNQSSPRANETTVGRFASFSGLYGITDRSNRFVTELLPTDAGLVHQATLGDREGGHTLVVSTYCSRIFFTTARAG